LLYQQHAGPEQIDKTVYFGFVTQQLFYRMLKRANALVSDAENLEKINPKRFGLRVFIGSVCPSAAEGEGAGFDFVPG
jgi:hypothetical protein